MKRSVAALIIILSLRSLAWAAGAETLSWDALAKTYRAKPGEERATFVFLALNPSSHDVTVTSVTTSCGCTVAEFPTMPWTIAAGQVSELHVSVDFKGKWGEVEKTVEVDSSVGKTALTVRVDAGEMPSRVDVASLLSRAAKVPAIAALPPSGPLVASKELTAAVASIANEPDGILRYQRTEELVDSMPEKDFPLVLNVMLVPGGDKAGLTDLAAKVFRRWTEVAPERAIRWLRYLPDGDAFGRETYGIAGAAVANANPAAALEWLRTVPRGSNRGAAEMAVAAVIARRDPRRALDLALDLPTGGSRDGLLSYCVLNWSVADFDRAAHWVSEQPDLSLRESLAARMATQLGTTDTPRAANFAISALRPGEAQNRCVAQIVRFWTAAAPATAGAWVSALAAGSLRDSATRAFVETYARTDPTAVRDWLAGCASDNLRQVGEATLASMPPNAPRVRVLTPGGAAALRPTTMPVR